MTWAAAEPQQVNPHEWSGRLREHAMEFVCHLVYAPGNWRDGTHKTAAAALSCAEREARARNRAEEVTA